MVWHELKNHVRSKLCSTKEEVVDAIHEFKELLTPEKCQAYIKKIEKVINLKINVFVFYLNN